MRGFHITGTKGAQGEKQVARHLRWLNGQKYIVLSDLMLPRRNGLTQIDHVVVSVYGIFVIETKNYHGTICGTDRKEFWMQLLHGRQYSLRNPFRQNYAHIQALMQLLELEEDLFFSVVAFADDASGCRGAAGALSAAAPAHSAAEGAAAFLGGCTVLCRRDPVRQSGYGTGTGSTSGTD